MKKNLNDYMFVAQLLALPFSYVLAFLKVLVVIPSIIIAKCNDIMESIIVDK